MVNFNERWIYKGSVTTPPCATYVYWNVLSTVYPIQQRHLDLFKKQLAKATEGEETLAEIGNYREVQKIDEQGVVYVAGGPGRLDYKDEEISDKKTAMILFIVLFVLTGIVADILLYLWCMQKKKMTRVVT